MNANQIDGVAFRPTIFYAIWDNRMVSSFLHRRGMGFEEKRRKQTAITDKRAHIEEQKDTTKMSSVKEDVTTFLTERF